MNKETFTLAIGKCVTSKVWKQKDYTFEEFAKRCENPKVTDETFEEYLNMSHDEKRKAKDVGGFVAAVLKDGQRNHSSVVMRTAMTFDIDEIDPENTRTADQIWDKIVEKFPNTSILAYSTHSHSNAHPRIRIIVPFPHFGCKKEMCEFVMRYFANKAEFLNDLDPCTFDVERLFFWPSVSKDGDYFYKVQYGDPYWPGSSFVKDWQDQSKWPLMRTESAPPKLRDPNAKVQDPLLKDGFVGTFCRAYPDIAKAIQMLLPDIYKPGDKGRFSYMYGSTNNGVILYPKDSPCKVFAYSNHGTDPAHRQCLNIFDLVRIHRFGNLDSGVDAAKTSPTDMPSYKAMLEFIKKDSNYQEQLRTEMANKAAEASHIFDGLEIQENDESPTSATKNKKATKMEKKKAKEDYSWVDQLETKKSGEFKANYRNLHLIFEKDSRLNACVAYNEFANRWEIGSVPASWGEQGQKWKDKHEATVRDYIGRTYDIQAKDIINDMLALVAEKHKYHPVRDYLSAIPDWDGTPRIDTLISDYLGCEVTPLTSAMMRKILVAAVARILKPGEKFDNVLILVGPEGIGKSTLLRQLGGEWFSDCVYSMEGKDGIESLMGRWIVEIGELDAVKKSELSATKGFLSRQVDIYRKPYAKHNEEQPRQCVIFGTTNEEYFLKGDTGNRRMWIVEVTGVGIKKDVFAMTEDTRAQIWAEAKHLYSKGETLTLSREMEAEAKKAQRSHNADIEFGHEHDLLEFLEIPLPADWYNRSLEQRRDFFKGKDESVWTNFEPREHFCIQEYLCEYIGFNKTDPRYKYEWAKVQALIKGLKGWKSIGTTRKCGKYLTPQKTWERIDDVI